MPVIDTNALPTGERLPGWKDHTFSTGKMTFAHFAFMAGTKIHEHCHSNEEVWTVTDGELEVTIGGDSIVARPGLVAIVPPNTAHSVRAITDGKAIVTDSPVRTDLGGGRRGVVAIDFDRPISLPEHPSTDALKISFAMRNWGKTRVVVKQMMIDPGIAPALPPATTTEIPSGELPTFCVLEPGERRLEQIAFAGLARRHLDDLRSGAALFYVKGVVLYDDDFGVRQHRTFCSVYDRDAFDHQGGFVIPAKPGYNYGT